MPRCEADSLFRTFAQTGDPAALAQVFDLLASDLLLVAAHLARDSAEAEDLVQATFVRAIEERARYDPARPVRPWLVGILGNLALQGQRRAARRLDPARLDAHDIPTPAEHAQERELVDEIARAIETLPRHDRQTLTLRLVHGFAVAQIARALALPLPTAKARLRRGLARLRKALPDGLARGAVAAVPADGLGAIRGRVLARAAQLAPPAAVAAGGIGAKVAIGAVLLALGAIATWSAWPVQPAPLTERGAHAVLPVAAAAPAPASEPETRVPKRRTLSDGAAATPALRGRCVARESGAPLAGCAIAVKPQGTLLSARDAAAWREVEQRRSETVSGPDGTFEVAAPAVGRFGLQVDVRAEGRVRAACTIETGTTAADLGDVALALPIAVSGRIVDTLGTPVEGVRPRFAFAGELVPGAFFDKPSNYARPTDRDGRFEVRDGMAGGPWTIIAAQVEPEIDLPCIRPELLEIPPGVDRVELEIVVLRHDPSERIAGIVCDPQGQPIDGVLVTALGEGPIARTREDGMFEIHRGSARDTVPSLSASDPRWRFVPTIVLGSFRRGRADAVITMQPTRSLRVEVVDAASDEPVERFDVHRSPGNHPTGELAVTYEPRGVAIVPAIALGHSTLQVVPLSDAFEPSPVIAPDAHLLDGGVLRVRLQRRGELHVRVRRPDGSPVVGSTVEALINPDHTPLPPASAPLERLSPGPVGGMVAAQLASGTTHENGECMLRVAPADRGRAMRVRGEHATLELRDIALHPGPDPLVLVVTDAAVLRGRVHPLALLQTLRASELPSAPGDPFLRAGLMAKRPTAVEEWFSPMPAPFDDEGRFEISGLPPGSWELHLRYFARHGGTGGSHLVRLGVVPELRPGEQRAIELDLGPARPGTLTGRVELDGAAFAGRLLLMVEDPPQSAGAARTDADGSFRFDGCAPGRYRLWLVRRSEQTGRDLHVATDSIASVLPGETTDEVFRARRRTARVRIFAADGVTPVAHRFFQLPLWSMTSGLPPLTDADGWLVLDPAPAEPFTLQPVELRADGFNWDPLPTTLGPLAVPAGETSATFSCACRSENARYPTPRMLRVRSSSLVGLNGLVM